MVSIHIDTRDAMKLLQRQLRDIAREQIPFATALALTTVAKKVAGEEASQLSKTFNRPTFFTLRAFGVIAARKNDLRALVFAHDRQGAYLEPYLDGGRQVLFSKKGMLTPADIPLNAYGNLPRGKLKSLKGRPDVFIGKVKTRSGHVVDGVWQRLPVATTTRRRRGQVEPKRKLKLLIVFTDPQEVHQRLPYGQRARKVVDVELRPQWEAAVAKALATAR